MVATILKIFYWISWRFMVRIIFHRKQAVWHNTSISYGFQPRHKVCNRWKCTICREHYRGKSIKRLEWHHLRKTAKDLPLKWFWLRWNCQLCADRLLQALYVLPIPSMDCMPTSLAYNVHGLAFLLFGFEFSFGNWCIHCKFHCECIRGKVHVIILEILHEKAGWESEHYNRRS